MYPARNRTFSVTDREEADAAEFYANLTAEMREAAEAYESKINRDKRLEAALAAVDNDKGEALGREVNEKSGPAD
jgi:CHASE3 domain sensor protein